MGRGQGALADGALVPGRGKAGRGRCSTWGRRPALLLRRRQASTIVQKLQLAGACYVDGEDPAARFSRWRRAGHAFCCGQESMSALPSAPLNCNCSCCCSASWSGGTANNVLVYS